MVKKKIPSTLRRIVWQHCIGKELATGLCQCCYKNTVSVWDFHVAHIVAETKGGKNVLENLTVSCASCNLSMGTENLIEFQIRNGFKPPPTYWERVSNTLIFVGGVMFQHARNAIFAKKLISG